MGNLFSKLKRKKVEITPVQECVEPPKDPPAATVNLEVGEEAVARADLVNKIMSQWAAAEAEERREEDKG